MAHGYPILLDLRGRLIVIVGGGGVAVRKARGLLAAGAGRIRCVAPEIDQQMPPEVERIIARFEPAHLEGAGLVFAATDSEEVNTAVVKEARRRGIWVNRADEGSEAGDFTVPAILESDPVVVAVWAGGNPAMAAKVRDELDRGGAVPRLARMAKLMRDVRPIMKQAIAQERRAEAFGLLASEEAMRVLERDGEEGVWRWLAERFGEVRNRKSKIENRQSESGGMA